jgi:hypothetical protein
MKNLKSWPGTSSTMSTPAQHAETYMRACQIESYEEDGEVYNRDKLLVRPYDLIFMKEHVPEKFMLVIHSLCAHNFPKDLFHSGDSITGT